MHKLIEYICDELEELERKADKDGKLSMQEIQYMDTLAHAKKNLLKSEEMMEDEEYSMSGGSYAYARDGRGDNRGGNRGVNSYESYARGRGLNARRDSMGRYSREGYSMAEDDFRMELQELMQNAPNDNVKHKLRAIMSEM